MAKEDYSNEAYVYWYYNKNDFKTYFGSRAAYEGSYKDDFITNYNSSATDEEFFQALENGELVGEVIAVFTGETYEKVGKRAVVYENDLIELYWDNVGKEHSYNHYANGKFSNIGRKATEEEKEEQSKKMKKIMNNPEIKHQISETLTNNPYTSKTVLQYDLNGNFIKEFPSMAEAERATNANHIGNCCNNTRNHSGGYQWRLKEDENYPLKIEKAEQQKIPVLQYDLDGNFIAEYKCINDALRKTGANGIGYCCKGIIKQSLGYQWRFKEDENYPLKINSTAKQQINKPKKVLQYDLNGKFIAEYPSIGTATKVTNISHISCCCSGNRKQAGGFIWRYKE